MSLTFLSLPALLAGAALLAGLLYGMQRLTERRRVVELASAVLWQQMLRQQPARTLGKRFRHWVSYVLTLLIALLLWLAVARPEASLVPGERQWYYLDASAALVGGARFDQARRALLDDLRTVAPQRRAVYFSGSVDALLLAPGEDLALLSARLENTAAAPRPSSFERWLGEPRPGAHGADDKVRYYGSAASFAAARRATAKRIALEAGYLAAAVPNNRGIVALGASPAASGDWDRADVLVQALAADGRPVALDALAFSRNGHTFTARAQALGEGRYLLAELPTDGSLLTIALRQGDDFPVDDHAALRLPARHRITVALAPQLPAAFAEVVRADPALRLGDPAHAEVAIRHAGDRFAPKLPALLLADPGSQADTFVFAGPGRLQPSTVTAQLQQLGIDSDAAARLTARLQRPITLGAQAAERRSLSVWSSVFESALPTTQSRTLPLFLSKSLRWLAAPAPWISYAQAATALPDPAALYGESTEPWRVRDLLGDELWLAQAGARSVAGRPFSVSLLDPAQTRAAAVSPSFSRAREDDATRGSMFARGFTLLMLMALLLLVLEWWFYQRGAIP